MVILSDDLFCSLISVSRLDTRHVCNKFTLYNFATTVNNNRGIDLIFGRFHFDERK